MDVLLTERGLFASREKARTAVMAGLVFVNGLVSDKPGMSIDVEADISVRENTCPYVSRGGLKLKKAIDVFCLDLTGAAAMDIGASTGGFTDCLLRHGAAKVYAVDVGYGQLDYKLRIDPRVVNMEKVNIRYLDTYRIADEIDFVSIDVSFISVNLVFPVAAAVLRAGGHVVCLVKPQFEAGREQVGKKGIIRDKKIHAQAIEKVISYGGAAGFSLAGLTFSPMTGAKGNIEFLLHFENLPGRGSVPDVSGVVEQAHKMLLS